MTTTESETSTLRAIPADECRRLLTTRRIGRLGVVVEHFPLVIPVNYTLDGEVVVLRMASGTTLAALHHANVSFEVDVIDERTRSGWSVLVRGLAEELTPQHRAELVARTQAADPQPWAPGERGHWVRLIPQGITGRRIVPGQLPPAFEAAGYL
ncbi:pyridoxamine 5'-phosphate oxidase family protein [Actinomycetes bacterium KLBMP 9759]